MSIAPFASPSGALAQDQQLIPLSRDGRGAQRHTVRRSTSSRVRFGWIYGDAVATGGKSGALVRFADLVEFTVGETRLTVGAWDERWGRRRIFVSDGALEFDFHHADATRVERHPVPTAQIRVKRAVGFGLHDFG